MQCLAYPASILDLSLFICFSVDILVYFPRGQHNTSRRSANNRRSGARRSGTQLWGCGLQTKLYRDILAQLEESVNLERQCLLAKVKASEEEASAAGAACEAAEEIKKTAIYFREQGKKMFTLLGQADPQQAPQKEGGVKMQWKFFSGYAFLCPSTLQLHYFVWQHAKLKKLWLHKEDAMTFTHSAK